LVGLNGIAEVEYRASGIEASNQRLIRQTRPTIASNQPREPLRSADIEPALSSLIVATDSALDR
jgi:hypothetical protein